MLIICQTDGWYGYYMRHYANVILNQIFKTFNVSIISHIHVLFTDPSIYLFLVIFQQSQSPYYCYIMKWWYGFIVMLLIFKYIRRKSKWNNVYIDNVFVLHAVVIPWKYFFNSCFILFISLVSIHDLLWIHFINFSMD